MPQSCPFPTSQLVLPDPKLNCTFLLASLQVWICLVVGFLVDFFFKEERKKSVVEAVKA